MGVRKFVKKRLDSASKKAKSRSTMADLFVPGLGTVLRSVATQYDKLSKTNKDKFHRKQGKAAKERFLKSLK